jgi:hypothetical protein
MMLGWGSGLAGCLYRRYGAGSGSYSWPPGWFPDRGRGSGIVHGAVLLPGAATKQMEIVHRVHACCSWKTMIIFYAARPDWRRGREDWSVVDLAAVSETEQGDGLWTVLSFSSPAPRPSATPAVRTLGCGLDEITRCCQPGFQDDDGRGISLISMPAPVPTDVGFRRAASVNLMLRVRKSGQRVSTGAEIWGIV